MNKTALILLFFLPLPALFGQSYRLQYKYSPEKKFSYKRVDETVGFTETQTGLSADVNKTVELFFNILPERRPQTEFSFTYHQDTAIVTDRSYSKAFLARTFDLNNILTKKPVKVVCSALGILRSATPTVSLFSGVDVPPGLQEQVIARQAMVFPVLPERSLEVGMSWTDEQRDTLRPQPVHPELGKGQGLRYLSAATQYTVAGLDTVLGRACLRIQWNGTRSLESKTIFPGNETFMEEETRLSGTMAFDPAQGVLVRMTSTTQTSETTAIFTRETAIIPSTSTITTTIELLQ